MRPGELKDFMTSFGGYMPDEKAVIAEIVAAIPDGTDIVKAIDETALWMLTDKTHGIAAYVPRPAQTRNRCER